MNTPTLETERLRLRKFTADDMEAIYQIYSDEVVNQFLPCFPLKSREEARAFFEKRYASKYALPQAYAYAVCLKRDNYPIGYLCVDMDEPHDLLWFEKGILASGDHESREADRAGEKRRHSLSYGNA
ncbi:MAG: GNAT family N-acetyltransferase [Holdemania massiliensis]